jgi:hypothetical protein
VRHSEHPSVDLVKLLNLSSTWTANSNDTFKR